MKITREIDRKMDLRLSSLLALQDLEKMVILRHHFGTFLAWVPIFVWKYNNMKKMLLSSRLLPKDIYFDEKNLDLVLGKKHAHQQWIENSIIKYGLVQFFGTNFFCLRIMQVISKRSKLQWKLKEIAKNHAQIRNCLLNFQYFLIKFVTRII